MMQRVVSSSRVSLVSRCFSTSRCAMGKALVYSKNGNPNDVLSFDKEYEPKAEANQVLVKMLNAPINLRDLSTIRNGSVNSSSTVPGDEGLGVIKDPGTSGFSRGDWVIPAKAGLGTWRSELYCNPDDLLPIRKDIPAEIASFIGVSPVTAQVLLDDFVDLKNGDFVILNGGSGVVGQTVTQLCRLRGIKVISILKERDLNQFGDLVERTKNHGAYIVISEDTLYTHRFRDLLSDLPKPKLALDCSGGKMATEMARLLADGGTMVSYDNVSKQPVLIPSSLMLFKDIQLRSFNFNSWLEKTSRETQKNMVDKLATLVKEESLHLYAEAFEPWDFTTPIKEMAFPRYRKFVFTLHDDPLSYY